MNANEFETWKQLHAKYDLAYHQGQKLLQLQTLHRIVNPMWNNVTQQPNDFVRLFNHWKDEISNYEDTAHTHLDDAIKTSMFLNR
eukprot:5496212-Amphidinium_carterae.1